ncbi:MAG: 16S rRNA (uracil(1498)-N(3))-methyltransferase [Clostridia bacterium]|nr:16S rRNA (uracil(1498)-N(3))-methyltransferase [Clostridia bacterium]
MEIKRFFADVENFDGRYIIVDGEEYVHMSKVLRHKVGYQIIVNLDDGKDYYCVIREMCKEYAKAEVEKVIDNECKAPASVTLFQALPKGDKLDLITQKCVELGVEKIVPFMSKYVNESKFNFQRANRIALEACKQCGRARKAQVGELLDFDGLLNNLDEYDTVIIPYEHAEIGKISDVKGLDKGKKIALIIGSEGGFAPEEVEEIIAKKGQVVSLGKRILRCETASIIASALIMYEMGDLQG